MHPAAGPQLPVEISSFGFSFCRDHHHCHTLQVLVSGECDFSDSSFGYPDATNPEPGTFDLSEELHNDHPYWIGGSGLLIYWVPAGLAVDETSVILVHPPLPLVGVSIVMERERPLNDSLVNG